MSKKDSKSKGNIKETKTNTNNPSLSKDDDKKKSEKDKDLGTKANVVQPHDEAKPKKGQKTHKQ
jgi:hypothetical protein